MKVCERRGCVRLIEGLGGFMGEGCGSVGALFGECPVGYSTGFVNM